MNAAKLRITVLRSGHTGKKRIGARDHCGGETEFLSAGGRSLQRPAFRIVRGVALFAMSGDSGCVSTGAGIRRSDLKGIRFGKPFEAVRS